MASKRILGVLEAAHGGHEASRGNPCKIFLSHQTRVGLVATTPLPVPETASAAEIFMLRVAETRTDKIKFLTGCMVELCLRNFSDPSSFLPTPYGELAVSSEYTSYIDDRRKINIGAPQNDWTDGSPRPRTTVTRVIISPHGAIDNQLVKSTPLSPPECTIAKGKATDLFPRPQHTFSTLIPIT
ncbi:uncharacterized protein LACBIDRAFT_304574 [Laccaria bicolor S238N-H82]|uniref:Predicted protein n=1 Tax=Laccaria bicolor (strain S238N-H82 / ATCC MYA-4686) TaxID=486041 RepID=B0DLX7_LACBS|nr:uncharacterized protein LACBIDRAFT_304574 [Laccaria bicolor S238N-H82]EDR04369.1 predicted protein [Laccaria bicolor S238N-H82]|eukprot:XP_001884888.1 predicted protein [Laccaria bicolor S238N-H82]